MTQCRDALDHPMSDPERGSSLYELSNVLYRRFDEAGERTDLDEAIRLLREALDCFPSDRRVVPLYTLATALHARFQQYGEPTDLDEAITLHRQALDLRPSDDVDHVTSLNNLASALENRFEQGGGEHADLDEAVLLRSEALNAYTAGC